METIQILLGMYHHIPSDTYTMFFRINGFKKRIDVLATAEANDLYRHSRWMTIEEYNSLPDYTELHND
jgi:hypothetical protein